MGGAIVLVTGGGGLIGAEVVRQLLDEGHDVVVFDRVSDLPNLAGVADRIAIVTGDVFDEPSIAKTIRTHRATHVVHLAGLFAPAPATPPIELVRTNVLGTAAVFEAARAAGIERVVWTSTVNADEFDEPYDHTPVDESHRVSPRTLYGATKYACEVMAAEYARAYGMDVVGIRPPMVYGAGRDSKALHAAIRDVARGLPSVLPYLAESRVQPIHVEDMGRFLVLALFAPGARPQTYNTPVTETVTGVGIAAELEALSPGAMVSLGARASFAGVAPVMDGARARADIGFEPAIGFAEGMRRMFAHYRANASTPA